MLIHEDQPNKKAGKEIKGFIFKTLIAFEKFVLNYSHHHVNESTPQIKLISSNLGEWKCRSVCTRFGKCKDISYILFCILFSLVFLTIYSNGLYSTKYLITRPTDQFIEWLKNRLKDWLTDYMTDWQIDILNDWQTVVINLFS